MHVLTFLKMNLCVKKEDTLIKDTDAKEGIAVELCTLLLGDCVKGLVGEFCWALV